MFIALGLTVRTHFDQVDTTATVGESGKEHAAPRVGIRGRKLVCVGLGLEPCLCVRGL